VFDRARALEIGFADAWNQSYVRDEPMRGDSHESIDLPKYSVGDFDDRLSGTWSPDGAAPALFLNTTNVATGSRISISPIKFKRTATAQHITDVLCDELSSVDMPLTTAVSLSARFPWLTPPGWLDLSDSEPNCANQKGPKRVYLADGGYFENSGLETAIELATFFEKMFAENAPNQQGNLHSEYPHGLNIRIIMIFSSDKKASAPVEATLAHIGEIMPPIDTMLATRTARTRAVHVRAVQEGQVGFSRGGGKLKNQYIIEGSNVVQLGTDEIHQVGLDRSKFNLPLGWILSTRSIAYIGSNNDPAARLVFELVEEELSGRPTDKLKNRLKK
jgi:hypothetical protein